MCPGALKDAYSKSGIDLLTISRQHGETATGAGRVSNRTERNTQCATN